MSLGGRGIVVTRPRERAAHFARLIEAHDGRAFIFPTLEIEPLAPPPALARLAEYPLVIFVSPSAVRVARRGASDWPPRRAAAVGPGTRRELELSGVASVIAPTSGADSEALLSLPEMQQVAGERLLIVRGDEGRELLAQTLAARGARVEVAACYRRARPPGDCAPLYDAWRASELHAITVLSAQALDNFIAMGGAELARSLPVFAPHERIARHARDAGVGEAIVAGAGDEQMLERLVAYFHERS
jgi:uroporphyrinogen-III synthase